jgi:hypothetical protein
MTEQPKEYIIMEDELKDLVVFRMPAYTTQVFVIESNVQSRPVSTPPVPDSTHLIEMAKTEWKNREERRGIHNREDWCCGWMAGFLSVNKPDWSKEHDAAIAQAAREDERKKSRNELLKDLQKFIDNADSRIGCPNGTLGVAYLIQWMGGQGWDCD